LSTLGVVRLNADCGTFQITKPQNPVHWTKVQYRGVIALCGAALALISAAPAQEPAGPTAVGVITAEYRPMSETTEINGRIQARGRVDLVARVTTFLDERLFVEGAEVK
jgi:multidrug efflux pump subunit AcrA (membrane-fusion protein)